MKTTIISAAFMTLLIFFKKDKLTGRWETKPSPKGNVTGIVFKEDKTFEGYINKKPFVTGKYTLCDNLLSFTDNGCGGSEAIYKVIFFSYNDSLRFEPVSDTCTERRNGMIRTILGRKK